MSATVHIATPAGETHAVEVESKMTVHMLYEEAKRATGLLRRFDLRWEGVLLEHEDGAMLVQNTGISEGCVLEAKYSGAFRVRISQLGLKSDDVYWHAKEDPDMVLILDVSGVHDTLCLNSLPDGVRHLKIVDPEQTVTVLGRQFLFSCVHLITLDVTSLANLRHVEEAFLHSCTSLTALECNFSCVESIGDFFLSTCTSLARLDLTSFHNVTCIGHGFMAYCLSLETLDVTPLGRVETIKSSFLDSCVELKALDITPMVGLRSVGDSFLGFECDTELTAAPFQRVLIDETEEDEEST
eukprot:TRINITY_DN9377_c0_g1_i1.p1 TRINITY_DN9377_c0_g1~~TRINITY_DN9377_c0_g1_i1.p1  ORF type:complete len:298 (+),score=36.01 TRINITY_DN9377_c0_g1_i1:195-1088(+)